MITNYVLLIHGMGDHTKKGWSKKWLECIEANAKLFAPYADGSRALSDDVKFIEIEYDSVFEQGYRQRWKNLAGALKDAALPSALKPALQEIAQVEDARIPEFAWTHLLDPLLWFGLKQARQAVIAQVNDQIGKHVKAAIAAKADVHILAHSLGTSVIHDSLLCLASEFPASFDPGRGGKRFKSLTTVANVSRFLNATDSPSDALSIGAFKPHESRVRPGDLVADFVNVRHTCDPFTFPRTFAPDWKTPAVAGISPDRFDELLNIHDLQTQFDHPIVARECLSRFTGRRTLGAKPEEMPAAWKRYEKRYGKSGAFAFQDTLKLLHPDANRDLGLGELARYLTSYVKEALA